MVSACPRSQDPAGELWRSLGAGKAPRVTNSPAPPAPAALGPHRSSLYPVSIYNRNHHNPGPSTPCPQLERSFLNPHRFNLQTSVKWYFLQALPNTTVTRTGPHPGYSSVGMPLPPPEECRSWEGCLGWRIVAKIRSVMGCEEG